MNQVFDSDRDKTRDKITTGTRIVYVRNDFKLVAALIAVGIRLRDDPPYTHVELKSGKDVWTFAFHCTTDDGKLSAEECIMAWRKDLDFMLENPDHPFAYVMATLKAHDDILDWVRNKDPVPRLGFRIPASASPTGASATVLVRKGSEKEKAARARGFQQL